MFGFFVVFRWWNSAATTALLNGRGELVQVEQRQVQGIDLCQSRPTYRPELNKENEEYEEFLVWKRGMDLKSMSGDLKDSSAGINDGSNLLHSRGLVFQNLSNCNISITRRKPH
jgi:hypothetical protein